jgi:ribosome biogenesis protein MAK21
MGKKSKKSANGDDLPTFDENALSALTARIEKGFGNKTNDQKEVKGANGSLKDGGKRTKSQSGGTKSNGKDSELARGTKRDAYGNAKLSTKPLKKSKSKPDGKDSTEAPKDDKAVLLAEILALGGTEEDLELVEGAFSDEEDAGVEATRAPDKSFRKDLAAFVAGLGIEGAVVADDQDSEVEEEGGEDEEEEEAADDGWEEASDVESSVDAPQLIAEPEPIKKPSLVVPAVTASNDPNRLVSSLLPHTWSS